MNRYLKRKMRRKPEDLRGMRDYRSSRMDERYQDYDRMHEGDRTTDYEDNYSRSRDRNYHDPYDMKYDRDYDRRSRRDYMHDGYDRYSEYYDYEEMEKEYHEDLNRWIGKLKRKDKFGLSYDEVIQHAKNNGVSFNDFDEKEFYAVYLMVISDFKSISNDPNVYIKMAKDFLYDDDIEVTPKEKLCIYYYKIVKGEE